MPSDMRRVPKPRRLLATAAAFAAGVAVAAAMLPRRAGVPSPLYSPSKVERALETRVPELTLEAMPFDETIALLGDLWDVEITADWAELGEAGFDRTATVSLNAQHVTLAEVLPQILTPVRLTSFWESHDISRQTVDLGYQTHGTRILIRPAELIPEAPEVVRAYEVADFLSGPQDVTDPPRGGGGGGGLFGGVLPSPGSGGVRDQLIGYISDALGFEEQNFGEHLWCIGTKLIVTARPEEHRRVRGLLAELRGTLSATAADAAAEAAAGARPSTLRVWDERDRRWVSPRASDALAALHRRLGPVRIEGVSFDEAVEMLNRRSGAPIRVDAEGLAVEKFDRGRPVHVRLDDPTLFEALKAVIGRYGWPAGPSLVLDGGVIVITNGRPKGTAETEPIQRSYDIRPLLAALVSADLKTASDAGRPPPDPADVRQTVVEELIEYLNFQVDPDSWQPHGGDFEPAHEFHGRLIVTQTADNHGRILAQLNLLLAEPIRLRADYDDADDDDEPDGETRPAARGQHDNNE